MTNTMTSKAGERTQPCFEIRAYSKTGIYSVEVQADNDVAAKRIARPQLEKMAFGKIHTITHCRLNPEPSMPERNPDPFGNPDGI